MNILSNDTNDNSSSNSSSTLFSLNFLASSTSTPNGNTYSTTTTSSSSGNTANSAKQTMASATVNPLILQAPQPQDILFFNESSNSFAFNHNDSLNNMMLMMNNGAATNAPPNKPRPIVKKSNSVLMKRKKFVRFPEDDKIIKDYSEAPKRGWMPGKHSTNDLLDAYIRSCDRHKSKPLSKLMQQLKALQDLDCVNGEKVNVLNLKSEKLDSRQVEALEEVFKRLSFKTIDLELAQFEDDTSASTLFEILDYYDTCEKLILTNVKGMGLYGWQELAKYSRKTISLENLELKGQTFAEFVYFTYMARSFRLTQSLRIVHLENSNINNRLLVMLAAALRDNQQLKEIYLADNKLQASDGQTLSSIIKENKCLEVLDLKNNNLQDLGLSHICSGLSEQADAKHGIRALILSNNGITANGISYLSKALIHNRSLHTINIGYNSLTNEAMFELKDGLIVNKQISCLILTKTKLTDEGVVAVAEYIAETQSLRRLDLRENDIRLAGVMALASSLKFNNTLDRLDIDREPKREYSIKDSMETSRRLIQDIHEFCQRNKRLQQERESRLREEHLLAEQQLYEIGRQLEEEKQAIDALPPTNSQSSTTNAQPNSADQTNNAPADQNQSASLSSSLSLDNEEDIDVIAQDDELLKKILNRTFNLTTPNLHSPIKPNDQDILNLFNLIDDRAAANSNNNNTDNAHSSSSSGSCPIEDEGFQLVESDLNLTPITNADLNESHDPTINEKTTPLEHCTLPDDQNLLNTNNQSDSRLNLYDAHILELIEMLLKTVESNIAAGDYTPDESFTIEKDDDDDHNRLQDADTTFRLQNCPGADCLTTSSSSNGNGVDEDDSDIEVLTISSNKQGLKSESSPNAVCTTAGDSGESSSASISNCASNSSSSSVGSGESKDCNSSKAPANHSSSPSSPTTHLDENDSSVLISNYDLLTDDNSLFCESSTAVDTHLLITPDLSPNINDTIDSRHHKQAIHDRFNNDYADELDSYIEDNKSQQASNQHHNELNNKEPFFASRLTNSQLSEELSHEIGLYN